MTEWDATYCETAGTDLVMMMVIIVMIMTMIMLPMIVMIMMLTMLMLMMMNEMRYDINDGSGTTYICWNN